MKSSGMVILRSLTKCHSGQTSLLEVLSVDAGMTRIANANYRIGRDYHYLMARKGPQQSVFAQAPCLALPMAD